MGYTFKRGAAILALFSFILSPGVADGLSKRRRRTIKQRRPRIEATLTALDKRTADSSIVQNGVIVRARRLTAHDCREYLGIRSLYNPIQLTIENYSDTSWVLNDKSIGLNLINYKQINRKIKWRRVGGVIGRVFFGFGAAATLAVIAIPLGIVVSSALFGNCGFFAASLPSIEAVNVAIVASLIVTPSLVFGLASQALVLTPIHTFAYIKSTGSSFRRVLNYTFDNQIVLHSGERVNLLVFVRNKEKIKFKNFAVTLHSNEQPEDALTFETSVFVKTRK